MKLEITEEWQKVLNEHREVINAWCDALESGEYAQSSDVLYWKLKNSFCCLGVLEHSVGKVPTSVLEFCGLPSDLDVGVYQQTLFRGLAPENINAILQGSPYPTSRRYNPADWNDTLNLTFNEISQLLRTGEFEIPNERLPSFLR